MARRFNARPHNFALPKRRKQKFYVVPDNSREVFCATGKGTKNQTQFAPRVIEEKV